MVSRWPFKKSINIDSVLPNYPGIYDVSSEVYSNVVYCASDGKFAVLKPDGAVFCPLHETPDLIAQLLPELQEEATAVYEQVKEMGLERVWMA